MANSRILLVEGTDDEHVLKHICGNRGITRLDEVRTHDGAPDLLTAMVSQLQASTGEEDVIGVVIDADKDLGCRWRSVCGRFLQAGYTDLPLQPDPTGTIIEPSIDSPLPRAGVWIMPDNNAAGILEHFLRSLVPQQDILFAHATDIVESLPVQGFGNNDKPKAVMHTWLAWQSTPGRPYGTAITAGFLDPNAPDADVLVSWLNRLFSP